MFSRCFGECPSVSRLSSSKAVHPSTENTFTLMGNLPKVRKIPRQTSLPPILGKTRALSTKSGVDRRFVAPMRKRFSALSSKSPCFFDSSSTRLSVFRKNPSVQKYQKARFRRGTCEDLLLTNGKSGLIASQLHNGEPQQVWCLRVEHQARKPLEGTAHGQKVWVWSAHRFSAPWSIRIWTRQVQKFKFTCDAVPAVDVGDRHFLKLFVPLPDRASGREEDENKNKNRWTRK